MNIPYFVLSPRDKPSFDVNGILIGPLLLLDSVTTVVEFCIVASRVQ